MSRTAAVPASCPRAAGTWARLRRHRTGFAALLVVVIYLLAAFAVEGYDLWCAGRDRVPVYAVEHPEARFSPPCPAFRFGTDYLGRDCFWRAVAGIPTAMKVGLIAAAIACTIGLLLGVVAGYYGGWIDEIVVWLYSVFAAMPTLLFILAFALLFTRGYLSPAVAGSVNAMARIIRTDPGALAVYFAIGLTGWVTICRVTRSETMRIKKQAYVQAAEVAGVRNRRILLRHLLPNLMHLAIIYFTLRFAYAILTEVIVNYLGLSGRGTPGWGTMISDGQERLWRGVWWEVAAASLLMLFLVLALNLLGDALRDLWDPRQSSRSSE